MHLATLCCITLISLFALAERERPVHGAGNERAGAVQDSGRTDAWRALAVRAERREQRSTAARRGRPDQDVSRRARAVGEIRVIARGTARGGTWGTTPQAVHAGWGVVACAAHGVGADAPSRGPASRIGFVPYLSNPPPAG